MKGGRKPTCNPQEDPKAARTWMRDVSSDDLFESREAGDQVPQRVLIYHPRDSKAHRGSGRFRHWRKYSDDISFRDLVDSVP